MAVAFGLVALHMKGVIFVPEDAAPPKVEAMLAYGAQVPMGWMPGELICP